MLVEIVEKIPWALARLFKREDEIWATLPFVVSDDLETALRNELKTIDKKIEAFNSNGFSALLLPDFSSPIPTAVEEGRHLRRMQSQNLRQLNKMPKDDRRELPPRL